MHSVFVHWHDESGASGYWIGCVRVCYRSVNRLVLLRSDNRLHSPNAQSQRVQLRAGLPVLEPHAANMRPSVLNNNCCSAVWLIARVPLRLESARSAGAPALHAACLRVGERSRTSASRR